MEELDLKEKLWGGIFGILAMLAAIGEMIANGISVASILGAAKDIFGTLIVVVLFVAVVKSMFPKKEIRPFSKRLEDALSRWQENNSNMISRESDSDGTHGQYGVSMKTDMNAFYDGSKGMRKPGVFFRLPALDSFVWAEGNIEIEFWLNRGTFFEDRPDLTKEEKDMQLALLGKKFANYISVSQADFCKASASANKVIVTVIGAIQSDEEISKLINLINGMYQAYLVSANIKIK